jgi:hypothetical protein
MATTELSPQPQKQRGRPLRGLLRPWLCAYTAVWLSTLLSALLVATLGTTIKSAVREVLGLALSANTNPPPSTAHAFLLAAHNLPIECWPVLLGALGARHSDFWGSLADGAVGIWVLVNTLPVGAAIGAYGAPLLPYIPQLPFEWAGLALGASAWLVQRRDAMTLLAGILIYALGSAVLLAAGALETFAVPHR